MFVPGIPSEPAIAVHSAIIAITTLRNTAFRIGRLAEKFGFVILRGNHAIPAQLVAVGPRTSDLRNLLGPL